MHLILLLIRLKIRCLTLTAPEILTFIVYKDSYIIRKQHCTATHIMLRKFVPGRQKHVPCFAHYDLRNREISVGRSYSPVSVRSAPFTYFIAGPLACISTAKFHAETIIMRNDNSCPFNVIAQSIKLSFNMTTFARLP